MRCLRSGTKPARTQREESAPQPRRLMQNRASRADSSSASPSNPGRPLPAGSAFTLLNAKPLVAFDSLEFPSLRLGLADPGAAGRCVMAIGAPGAQTVAAASIAAEFVRPLHLATVPASLHAFALLSLFFTFPRGKLARGVRRRPLKKRAFDPRVASSARSRGTFDRAS